MPTILNVDGSGNVVDVTTTTLALTERVLISPAVEPVSTGLLDANGNLIYSGGAAAVYEDVTRTASDLGSPVRTSCTQVILTAQQEAAMAAVQVPVGHGLMFNDGAFTTAASVIATGV